MTMQIKLLSITAIATTLALSSPAFANLDSECESRHSQRQTDDGQPVFKVEVTCQGTSGGSAQPWWDWFVDWFDGPNDPPPPIGGAPGSSPMRTERTNAINAETIFDAKWILTRPEREACRQLLGGMAGAALDVLNELAANNRIKAGERIDLDDPNPMAAAATVAKVSALGDGRSGTITLYGLFYGAGILPNGVGNLYTEEERVVALLHEIGHLTALPGCSPVPHCTPLEPYRHIDDLDDPHDLYDNQTQYEDKIRAACLPIPPIL
jgi:hypothetical protein